LSRDVQLDYCVIQVASSYSISIVFDGFRTDFVYLSQRNETL